MNDVQVKRIMQLQEEINLYRKRKAEFQQVANYGDFDNSLIFCNGMQYTEIDHGEEIGVVMLASAIRFINKKLKEFEAERKELMRD